MVGKLLKLQKCKTSKPYYVYYFRYTCGSRGGFGVGTPLENHKALGFLSSTDWDPLENNEATKPAFNVGPSLTHPRNAI